jgi:hypothetical protein
MSGNTGYVIAAYGVFVSILGAYVGILFPRMRRKRRRLAEAEAQLGERKG